MAKTQAFTHYIGPVGSNVSESNAINQSSPTWVLTFVRWNVRDTLRAIANNGVSSDLLVVRDPLVVENDCIQVSTSSNKATLTPSMSAVLVETDINYSTAIAPGDFVFVNMLNWEKDARRIAEIASSNTHANIAAANGSGTGVNAQINGANDGFKGVYKIQSVRKSISVDPESGIKRVLIKIDGYAFTEFNNVIYYNPYLNRDNQGSAKDSLLFATNIHADYKAIMTPQRNPAVQDIIKLLIQSFIGVGISDQGVTSVSGSPVTANTHFYIPQQVGIYLGVSSAKSAKDVYNYLFGIQQYSTSNGQQIPIQQGMNPSNIKSTINRFSYMSDLCGGKCLVKPEYWNQITAWSILNQYTNAPLNELYTCFRVSPTGSVMPTVVFRQMPFTTDFFGQVALSPAATPENAKVTKFSTLPRWQIDTALILASDIGRDEAARVNFVQFYAQPSTQGGGAGKTDGFIATQTASKNFVYDINDVTRSGLKPYVITTNFEDLTILSDAKVGKRWAQIIGDALMGGHLKMNGTIQCVGIVDPIAVGDNLEFDGIVFHIEEVTHSCAISNGAKTFRTTVRLSNGVSVSTSNTGIEYPEMEDTTGYNDRFDDYNYGPQILPGVSEEQDIRARAKDNRVAPTTKEVKKPDSPFAQPNQKIKKNKRGQNK
jgi:hypothetical protein